MGVMVILAAAWMGEAHAKKKSSIVLRQWVAKLRQNSYFNRRPFQLASPALSEGKIFVGVHRKIFYAIDAKEGEKIWKFKTQGPVYAQARVADGVVYFIDMEGMAYALETRTGKTIWISKIGTPVMSAPLVVGKNLYLVTLNKDLICLDRREGRIIWQVNFGNRDPGFTLHGSSDPVLVGSLLLVGYSDGMILAHRLDNGQVAWAKQFGDPFAEFHDVDATVQMDAPELMVDSNTRAYVTSADGQLFAFRPQDGTVLWQAPIGGVNEVTIANPYLYVTARGTVYCLQKESGQTIWEQDLPAPEISTSVVYANWLAVVATKGRIYFLDRNSGDILYSWHVRGGSYADPLLVGPNVYILSNASRLYAFQFRQ